MSVHCCSFITKLCPVATSVTGISQFVTGISFDYGHLVLSSDCCICIENGFLNPLTLWRQIFFSNFSTPVFKM